MDSTSIFEEDGDETFLVERQKEEMLRHKKPRMARLVSILYHHEHDEELVDLVVEDQEGDDKQEVNLGHRISQIVSSVSFLDRLLHRRSDADQRPTSTHEQQQQQQQQQQPSSSSSTYTLQALYYLSINYILGVGCLGIPYAFAKAGFILCTCILVVVSFSSFCTIMWVAEAGERYHYYWEEQHRQRHSHQQQQQQLHHHEGNTLLKNKGNQQYTRGKEQQQPSSEDSLLLQRTPRLTRRSASSTSLNDLVDLDDENSPRHQHWDRYEVVDLVGFYLGDVHKIMYQISLMALMYIGLLAYSQVFCLAVLEIFWGTTKPSIAGIPQLIFAAMVVPLSCIELDEQISVQSFMAAVRFVAIFVMVAGSVLSLWFDDSNVVHGSDILTDKTHGPPYWAPAEPESCRMSYTYCLEGFGVAFSTSLFSQLFQHSIPGLLRPLRDKPSRMKRVPRTLGASLLTTLTFYLLLGTFAASFFGSNTRASVNLNFANLTMGLDGDSTSIFLSLAVKLAADIVVIFPALDTISVFPLIANTLGNNMCAAAVGPRTNKLVAKCLYAQHKLLQRFEAANDIPVERANDFSRLPLDERQLYFARATRVTTIAWRLVAALPPLLGSVVAADLSFSLLLAGAAGVYVAFFAPSLMHLRSLSHGASTATPSQTKTIFEGWYSTTLLCYPILGFAIFSLVSVLAQVKAALLEILQS